MASGGNHYNYAPPPLLPLRSGRGWCLISWGVLGERCKPGLGTSNFNNTPPLPPLNQSIHLFFHLPLPPARMTRCRRMWSLLTMRSSLTSISLRQTATPTARSFTSRRMTLWSHSSPARLAPSIPSCRRKGECGCFTRHPLPILHLSSPAEGVVVWCGGGVVECDLLDLYMCVCLYFFSFLIF